MVRDYGIIEPGTTLYLPFHTFDSNDPTASVTLTGLATTDIEIYKDGSTTQRASDSGYALLDTDGIDFDGITGIHGISIDLADNTTAGFYAAGSQYWVVISSVTVDAATINFVLATFRIGYQTASLNTTIATLSTQTSFTLTAGPAEDDALNGQWAIIHDVASAVQKAVVLISDYTGASKTVTLAAGATFTAAAGDNISIMGPAPLQPATTGRTLAVESDGMAYADCREWLGGTIATPTATGVPEVDVTHYGGTAGTFASGVPAVNTTLIEGSDATNQIRDAVVDDATRIDASALNTASGAIGSNGSGLTEAGGTGDQFTAIPWNAAWDAEVQSEVEDGLVTHRLDELLNADSDIDGAAPPTVGSVFHELMSKTTGSFTFDQTTDSLEAVRDNVGTAGAGLTNIGTIATVTNLTNLPAITSNWLTAAGLATDAVNEIADAIWDEATSGHVTAGTFGKAVADTLALATGNDVYLSDITLRIPAALTAGGNMKSDLDTIKTQTVTCAGGVTIPAATLASTTNITGGTITTVTTTTNLTNAPTAGDFTSTMKTSIETAVQNFMEGVAVTDFTAIPVSTPTYSEALGFIYALGLNKHTCTSTTATIYDSDNNAVGTATVADDGVTFSRTRYS